MLRHANERKAISEIVNEGSKEVLTILTSFVWSFIEMGTRGDYISCSLNCINIKFETQGQGQKMSTSTENRTGPYILY